MRLISGCSRKNFGFSVIEIIVAIIILSILSTVSVNLMSGYKLRQNITSARQQLMNAMNSAMAAAQRDNMTYVVTYDNEEYVLRVCQISKCSSTSDQDMVFSADLKMFSKPEIILTGSLTPKNLNDIPASGVESMADQNKTYIAFTPFGKITSNGTGLGNTFGENYIFMKDHENLIINGEGLCIGVKYNQRGFFESIEKGKAGGVCK